MENEFAEVMSKRTDEELVIIVTTERDGYQDLAIEAAEAEIKKRNISESDFEDIVNYAKIEKGQKQIIENSTVGPGTRFIHFIIDTLVWMILVVLVIFSYAFIVGLDRSGMSRMFGLSIYLGTFIAYYTIMEIKFQKTIGKFVTKTKVVKMNGDKASNIDIVVRTFCRFIPFDQVSYLLVKNGFHDFLSKTKVIREDVK